VDPTPQDAAVVLLRVMDQADLPNAEEARAPPLHAGGTMCSVALREDSAAGPANGGASGTVVRLGAARLISCYSATFGP